MIAALVSVLRNQELQSWQMQLVQQCSFETE